MQMPVSYNNTLVLLSLVAAVLGACVSLATVARPQVPRWVALSAAAFMGFAVAGMHYLGIASMQMAAVIHWNIALVVASVAIGFVGLSVRAVADRAYTPELRRLGLSRRLLAAVLLAKDIALIG
jgi:NO-binding membrane sensor protein with MHYT domain